MDVTAAAPLAIEVRGLVRKYGDFAAVQGLDFAVSAGECVAILGPNGAGKTTTLEILEGLQPPTSGTVRLLGRSWSEAPQFLRERIGIQLQESRFPEKASVEETILLFRSFFREGMDPDEAIAMVALDHKRHTWVGKLSGGERQRMALAVAMASNPQILFLDEPTTGLDPHARRALWEVITTLRRRGVTLILTTHYMEEAERLCDRVLIIDRGRIVAEGTPQALIGALGVEQVTHLSTDPAVPPDRLSALPGVVQVRPRGDGLEVSVQSLHSSLPSILETLRQAGCTLTHLSTRQASLEDVFVRLTGRGLTEPV